MIKRKKGAFLQEATAKWILLIISAVILLIFLGLVMWKVFVVGDKACHYSIVIRSTFSYGFLDLIKDDIIPLRCEERKICFSRGGDCSYLGSSKKIEKIKIKGETDEEIKQNLYKELAELHAEAYWTVGEGKLNFMPRKMTSTWYCIPYAVFDFDEDLERELGGKLDMKGLYYYMQNNPVPNKEESILHYIYGINNFDAAFYKLAQKLKEKNIDVNKWNLDLSKQYAIFIKGTSRGYGQALFEAVGAGAATIVGVSLIASGIGAPAGIGILVAGGSVVGGVTFVSEFGRTKEHSWVPPKIIPYESEYFRKEGCQEFPFVS